MAPVVDGIVALDDGSQDATAEMLSSHPKLLHLGKLDIIACDYVQRFKHAGLQRRFHRGKGHGGGFIVLVILFGPGNRLAIGVKLGTSPGGGGSGYRQR